MLNQFCYFHKGKQITTFCTNNIEQCTLPMCEECLPIHLQEHEKNFTNPKILPYGEAMKSALGALEAFVNQHQEEKQNIFKRLNHAQNEIIQTINKYFDELKHKVQQSFVNLIEVQKKINKIKKGSIKTLIYYYAGDIKLEISQAKIPNLHHLSRKVMRCLQEEGEKLQKEKFSVGKMEMLEPTESIYEQLEKKSQKSSRKPYGIELKDIQHKTENHFQHKHEHRRIFQQEIKQQKQNLSKQVIQRGKSFDRAGIFGRNENNLRTRIHTIHTQKEANNKYKHQSRYQNERENVLGKEIGYRNRVLTSQQNGEYCYQNEESPISFQHRYQKIAEQKHKPEIKIEQESSQPLKISDLEVQNKFEEKFRPTLHEIQKKYKERVDYQRQIKYTEAEENRTLRSQSHNILQIGESKIEMDRFQVNKQVMSPDDIRKMLEKRIEQRSRILANRKNLALQDEKADPSNRPLDFIGHLSHERGKNQWNHSPSPASNKWDVRDSIIHQIQ